MSKTLLRVLLENTTDGDGAHAETTHAGGGDPDNEEILGGHSGIADVVFVVTGMLFIGIMTRSLLQRVPIPYTVWLLIWGLVAGATSVYAEKNHSGWEPVNVGLQTISDINPNGLLLIFMPILIYGSAQSMDWHILRVELAQILIMATSGVVVSMCFTAVAIYYIFPFGWSWYQCFMFGALISATDPVAVVALLKEVGASVRLGTIIEGESLLNDGTAFVLFLIFKEYVLFDSCCVATEFQPGLIQGCGTYAAEGECKPFTPGDATILFVKLSVGGPLSGLMFGFLLVLWLMFTYNDEIVEIFITITGAYITFYISEDIFSVSGVLSIVTLGFFMAAVGRSYISPRVLHPMETVWEILEFGANTVIFVLAGVIISEELYPILADNTIKDRAPLQWAGYGVLLYLICMVVRFVTIFLHLPILANLGYGITWQQAIVISWSGLRGAIGLALALLVNLDTALDQMFRYQVLLFTSIVVILTLVINGSSTKMLLQKLGILKPQAVKVEFLIHSINEMEDYADKHCSHLKRDLLVGDPDWDRVKELSNIDTTLLVDPVDIPPEAAKHYSPIAKANGEKTSGIEEENEAAEPLQGADDGGIKASNAVSKAPTLAGVMAARNLKQADVIRDVRARLLHGVKATYGEGFSKNYISPNQLLELQASVDRSLDKLDQALHDWDIVEPLVGISKLLVSVSSAEGRMSCLDPINQKLLFQELEHSIVVANSYVFAHSSTRQRLAATLEDTDTDNLEQETYELTKLAIELVIKESKEQSKKAIQQIKAMRYSYPEVTRAVKTKLVALTVINRKQKFVDQLRQGAIIEEKDYETLQRSLLIRSYFVKRNTWKGITLPEPKELLKKCIMFSSLSDEEFEEHVVPNAKHRLIASGETIFRKGDNSLNFYVIIRGTVSSETDQDKDKCIIDHQGSVIGVTEMVLGIPRLRTITASGICEAYVFEAETFAQLMVEFPTIEACAWQMCGATLAYVNDEPLVSKYTFEELRSFFHGAQVAITNSGDDVHIIGHTYLVYGSLESVLGTRAITQNTVKYDGPRMLGPGFLHLKVSSSFAVLLMLPANWAKPVNPGVSIKDSDIMMMYQVGTKSFDAKSMVHKSMQPASRDVSTRSMGHAASPDLPEEEPQRPKRRVSFDKKHIEKSMVKGTGEILNRMSQSFVMDRSARQTSAWDKTSDRSHLDRKSGSHLEQVSEMQRETREARAKAVIGRLSLQLADDPKAGGSGAPTPASAASAMSRSLSGGVTPTIPEDPWEITTGVTCPFK